MNIVVVVVVHTHSMTSWEDSFLSSLNVHQYDLMYPELSRLGAELKQHWEYHGKSEKRLPNISMFYNKYPTFSVSKYLSENPDLSSLNCYEALAHYWHHGSEEGRCSKFAINNRAQIPAPDLSLINKGYRSYICSNSLKNFSDRFHQHYGLFNIPPVKKRDQHRQCEQCEQGQHGPDDLLLFGVYCKRDIAHITSFLQSRKGVRLGILWGGTDITLLYDNPALISLLTDPQNTPRLEHIAISEDNHARLMQVGIPENCIYQIDHFRLFSPQQFQESYAQSTASSEDYHSCIPKAIYVYNGSVAAHAFKYSPNVYRDVIQRLDPANQIVIFSNKIGVPHHKMPLVYSNCRIGLRLTTWDGNANTVQEFNCLQIPIVTNFDDERLALPWSNVKSISRHISSTENPFFWHNSKILFNTHSNLSLIAGDTIMASNWVNHWMDQGNKVIVLSQYEIGRSFIANLIGDNYTLIHQRKTVDTLTSIASLSKKVDHIFIRNHLLPYDNSKLHNPLKTYFYGLDVHLEKLQAMSDDQYCGIVTQSTTLKDKYIQAGIRPHKIHIVPPFSYKYNFGPKSILPYIRIVYCGTLRPEENILQIISDFQTLCAQNDMYRLVICYGKICGGSEFKTAVNAALEACEDSTAIEVHRRLSHRDACYEIYKSDYGICQSPSWSSNGERSTKLMEYKLYGLNTITSINDLYEYDTPITHPADK